MVKHKFIQKISVLYDAPITVFHFVSFDHYVSWKPGDRRKISQPCRPWFQSLHGTPLSYMRCSVFFPEPSWQIPSIAPIVNRAVSVHIILDSLFTGYSVLATERFK